MKLFISLLLLILVGCAHSNFASHSEPLYFHDSKGWVEQNRQQYLDLGDLNHQQQKFPHLYPYTYTVLEW